MSCATSYRAQWPLSAAKRYNKDTIHQLAASLFKPLSLFIGLRYTRAKKRNHFISFISLISLLGIALGVLVLITVLSVMNGFDYQIKHRILEMVPQVTVTQWNGQMQNWPQVASQVEKIPGVTAVAPFVEGQAMMSNAGATAFGILRGITPKTEAAISPLVGKMTVGSLQSLKPNQFHIVLGKDLAARLGVSVGDKVTVYVPKANLSPVGVLPRLKQFTVSGIFSVGYQFDSAYALINLSDAAKLLMLGNNITGLQVKADDLYQAVGVGQRIQNALPAGYRVLNWTQQNANFFKALKMEKVMMFLILLLIIAVAAFNMLSSLVMVVTDKQSDIAILRTLGASGRTIMMTFVVQGFLIGLIGTAIGVIGGVALSLNVTRIVDWVQQLFHVQFLSASVYYISFVPSRLDWSDVWHIALVAMILSLLATLYPAWRAGRVVPAQALRYE